MKILHCQWHCQWTATAMPVAVLPLAVTSDKSDKMFIRYTKWQ
jgi:hypothetical protein